MIRSTSFALLLVGAAATVAAATLVPRAAAGPEDRRPLAVSADTVEIGPLYPTRYVPPPTEDGESEPPLEFRLRERVLEPTAPATPPRPTPLSAGESAALFARLPMIGETVAEPFRFPPSSPPPPRTGATVISTFPPPAPPESPIRPTTPAAEPLRVLRVVPEGETELAPHLTVTFSQAMVPLTSVAGTDDSAIPVRLTPAVEGRWRWIDTRTVRFQPEVRFPMATVFRVEIPATTRSEVGGVLPQAVVQEFGTPAPRATGGFPHAGHGGTFRGGFPDDGETFGLQPVIVLGFDQRVDAAAVVRSARLTAAGRAQGVRLASRAEIEADPRARQLVEGLEPERWVALRPRRDLPRDAEIRLELPPGAYSAEGVRATTNLQRLRFRTYAPLRVREPICHAPRAGEPCFPRAPVGIHFNNPLDTAAFRPEFVRVEPAIDGLDIRVAGSYLHIAGDTRSRTRYRVVLDPRIRDRWGQALGESRTLTFEVGDPQPLLRMAGWSMVVLDPAGPPIVRVQSRSHEELRVRVHRVTAGDWPHFSESLRRHRQDPAGVAFTPPGESVVETTVRPADGGRGYSEIPVDLTPALDGGLGHAVVVVEPRRPLRVLPFRARPEVAIAWVQATRIGLTALATGTEVTTWTSSLEDGRPLSGVELQLLPSGGRGASGPDGIGTVALRDVADELLVARQGRDVAILPDQEPGWHRGDGMWRLRPPTDRFAWYVASDRGLYRPGERAHVQGWVRRIEAGPLGDVADPTGVTGVRFTALGPRQEELQQGTAGLSRASGFHFTVDLPDVLNLGHAAVHIRAEGAGLPDAAEFHHHLQVHEFRRPEYEVRAEAGAGPHLVGSTVEAVATAAYFGGGALPNTEVEWRLTPGEGSYSPPGWDRWRFGRLPTWWRHGGGTQPESLTGRTDGEGAHRLDVELLRARPPFTTTLTAEVEVRDVNRQVGSASTSLLVHPGRVYVGLRTDRGWVRPGDTLRVELAGVDLDGAAVAGRPVRVWTEPLEDGVIPLRRPGAAPRDRAAPAETEHCLSTTAEEPVPCDVVIGDAGSMRLVAEIRDEADRPSRSEIAVWVAGGRGSPWMPEGREGTEVQLVADREEYAPGDTAEVLVRSPFPSAAGVMTLRRSGLLGTESFRTDSATHVLRVPITEAMYPSVQLHVELVDGARGVRSGQGQLSLRVPPARRELTVSVQPADSVVVPGAVSTVAVEVRDAAGNPVPDAEVALWMVDESVLALGRYLLPDPLEVFHPQREPGVVDHPLRQRVLLAPLSAGPGTLSGIVIEAEMGHPMSRAYVSIPELDLASGVDAHGEFTLAPVPAGRHRLRIAWEPGSPAAHELEVVVPEEGTHLGSILVSPRSAGIVAVGYGGARRMEAGPPPPPAPVMLHAREAAAELEIADVTFDRSAVAGDAETVELRTEFAPLAVFEPALRTDAAGRARVEVRLPQSLTRYRVMAVAVEGARRYGRGESTVTARRDLLVRPSAPRFLNFGDLAEIPLVVQNTTAGALTVDVGLRASGLEIEAPAAQRVTVAAGDRVEVRFSARARRAGTVRLQAIATAGALADAAEVELPVYTPATMEAFAVYGEMDDGRPLAIPVVLPGDVVPGFGGVEVTVSSTALQALTDAVLYLHTYPFEGAEQLASRILGISALRDVLEAFAAEGLPQPAELDAAVTRDVTRLASLQQGDGGWSLWRTGEPSHPYVSIHVAHALVRARAKGYPVPGPTLERAADYLRSVDRIAPSRERRPEHAHALNSYSLYVRGLLGHAEAAGEARRLVREARAEHLSPEAMGWLLHALARGTQPLGGEGEELLRRLRNRVSETAATATFATSYSDGEYLLLHSTHRSDAVVLEALIAADRGSDLIAKTARGLLAHRTAGRWRSTQENAWVLLALERYFLTFERATPRFTSRVWLGDRYAGNHEFTGRTTERHHLAIPLPEIATGNGSGPVPNGSRTELLLERAGEGRMYYRAGLRYAPADLMPRPAERGFTIERMYEAMDDPADVRREDDGSWWIRAGARVRVRISMLAPERRHHVALVDPLPAGLEVVNAGLAGTGFADAAPEGAGPYPVTRGISGIAGPTPRFDPDYGFRWWVHQNLRDDRAEAFATMLPAGSYEYTYVARATTPGTFVVPPSRAEEMYSPETFGRGAGTRVIVE